jgi:hypothetical protein
MFDEHQLRKRLEATAGLVSSPAFTLDGLVGRIRRQRAKVTGLATGSLLAVAAIAVAVPVAIGRPGPPPVSGVRSVPAAPVHFQLSFIVAVNGQSQVRHPNHEARTFTLTPGEHVSFRVGVFVAAHARVTNLWLGVSSSIAAPSLDGQAPPGLIPLAHARGPLSPGRHTFMLTWTMLANLPRGSSLSLVAVWQQPGAGIGAPIAVLVPPTGSWPLMSAAQACRQVVATRFPAVPFSFSGVERVRLVLTRYASGEPVEPTRYVGTPIPTGTEVWLVEVHAKAIHGEFPGPANYSPPARPDTDFSLVMNARTAVLSYIGEGSHWPLPLSRAGTVISLPPRC